MVAFCDSLYCLTAVLEVRYLHDSTVDSAGKLEDEGMALKEENQENGEEREK